MKKGKFPIFGSSERLVLFNPRMISGSPYHVVDAVLDSLGFSRLRNNPSPMAVLAEAARSRLNGASTYREKCLSEDAPDFVNCSTFTQWAYSQIGVHIPKMAIQQYQYGEATLDLMTLKVGDLLFKRGDKNYWEADDPKAKIGHVGIVTDVDTPEGEVIHATQMSGQVIAVFLDDYIKRGEVFVGVSRIVPNLASWIILEVPMHLRSRITSSDDLKWLIMENLPEEE